MIQKLRLFFREGPIYLQGLVGSGLILSCFLVTAIPFRDRLGRSYSIFTFFISELGQMGQSTLAIIFNAGIFLGGLVLIAFMIGLRRYFITRTGRLGVIIGALSAACAALVGVLPMNILYPHFTVASGFFYGCMAAILLFTLALMRGDGALFPRWTVLPGLAVFFIFGKYHVVTNEIFNLQTIAAIPDFIATVPIIRPASFWPLTFYEWLAVLAMNAWIILMSLLLWRNTGGK
jgi:hypothetical membrane protein